MKITSENIRYIPLKKAIESNKIFGPVKKSDCFESACKKAISVFDAFTSKEGREFAQEAQKAIKENNLKDHHDWLFRSMLARKNQKNGAFNTVIELIGTDKYLLRFASDITLESSKKSGMALCDRTGTLLPKENKFNHKVRV